MRDNSEEVFRIALSSASIPVKPITTIAATDHKVSSETIAMNTASPIKKMPKAAVIRLCIDECV